MSTLPETRQGVSSLVDFIAVGGGVGFDVLTVGSIGLVEIIRVLSECLSTMGGNNPQNRRKLRLMLEAFGSEGWEAWQTKLPNLQIDLKKSWLRESEFCRIGSAVLAAMMDPADSAEREDT
jgi:hypothetical protein